MSSVTFSIFPFCLSSIIAQPVLENNPQKQAELFVQKGLIKLLDNNYQGAIHYFNQAIELNSNYMEAYYQRGGIYARYGFGENPNPSQLPPGCHRVNQVIVCTIEVTTKWREENLTKALQDLDKSLELNPNYAPSYYQKGLIWEATGQRKKAIEAFQTATNLYLLTGLKYLSHNQPQKGADFLNYSNLSELKIQAITSLKPPTNFTTEEEDIGGSTQSPDRKKSPEELFSEGCELIKNADYTSALQKFILAARLFQDNNNHKRYQETQKIIQELKKY